jgi:hypothetical protein
MNLTWEIILQRYEGRIERMITNRANIRHVLFVILADISVIRMMAIIGVKGNG